ARLGAHRGGGAGADSRPRPVGVWAQRRQPPEPRDGPALHVAAGLDSQAHAARRPVRRHRPGRCRRGGRILITAIRGFAGFAAGLRVDQLPAALRERLALHVADAVGAWIAAARTGEGAALIAFHARMRERRAGAAEGAGGPDDLSLACALARSSEVDDI